ncbi:MAG: acyl carrier protein [Dokdonella sp.]
MSKPDQSEILAMLGEFLSERFDIPAQAVRSDRPLGELGLDSMMLLDVMLEFEDRLGIKLADMSLPRDATLQDVAALIERNTGTD